MKLLVIGVGNCGCNLAEEFAQLNRRAKAERRVNIITHAYAVNDDQTTLAVVTKSQSKSQSKWLQPVFIHNPHEGKNKSSEAGAELMRDQVERVFTAMKPGELLETDAVLLIAGSAGSLGSGGVPVIAQQLKGRYVGKPIYALIVLPFESESADSQYIHNTAICLNSIYQSVAAVFLVDNEGFLIEGNMASGENVSSSNKEIVLPFYDLLCASEMVDSGHVGSRALGIGDIMQTLAGWTAIGVGNVKFTASKSLWRKTQDFREKGSETLTAMEAMNAALSQLSTICKLEDAGKALYLLSVPSKEANIDMSKALGNHLRELAYSAVITGGDFHGAKDSVQVTVAISELNYVDKIKDYYDRAVNLDNKPKTKKKTG